MAPFLLVPQLYLYQSVYGCACVACSRLSTSFRVAPLMTLHDLATCISRNCVHNIGSFLLSFEPNTLVICKMLYVYMTHRALSRQTSEQVVLQDFTTATAATNFLQSTSSLFRTYVGCSSQDFTTVVVVLGGNLQECLGVYFLKPYVIDT